MGIKVLRKLAFVLTFFLLCGNIVIHEKELGHYIPRVNLFSKVDDHCFHVFADSFKQGEAHGVWDCMSPAMQQAYFSSRAWKGDADITAWMQKVADVGVRFEVIEYPGNPIKRCINQMSGSQVCTIGYLMYVNVYFKVDQEDVLSDQLSTSYYVSLDKTGKIDNIE